MYKPEYPEWWRREAMLWAIYEWVQDRPAGEDRIEVERLATLVGGGEYVQPTDTDPDKQAAKKRQEEQIDLFITLVEEGLIYASIHTVEEPPYFAFAKVRGLSERGLHMIQELPDPNQALLGRLDEMAAAIRGLQDVSEEEKDAVEKALQRLTDFAEKLAPPATVQILAALFRSEGG